MGVIDQLRIKDDALREELERRGINVGDTLRWGLSHEMPSSFRPFTYLGLRSDKNGRKIFRYQLEGKDEEGLTSGAILPELQRGLILTENQFKAQFQQVTGR